jgi:hypothetical protein
MDAIMREIERLGTDVEGREMRSVDEIVGREEEETVAFDI